METENIVCIRKLVNAHYNNPEGAQQHFQNMETVTGDIIVVKRETTNIKVLENWMRVVWDIYKCQCVVFMIEKIEHFGT